MSQTNCFIHVSKLCNSKRKTLDESCVVKKGNDLFITYCQNDNLDKFEEDINKLLGTSSFIYFFKNIKTSMIMN